MHQVKVFDATGNLKHIISAEEVQAISNEKFLLESGTVGGARKQLKYKNYPCLDCRKTFRSCSTRGAKYCMTCRKNAYKRSRKREKENA